MEKAGGEPRSCTELRGFRVHEISFRSIPRGIQNAISRLEPTPNYSFPDIGVKRTGHPANGCVRMQRSREIFLPARGDMVFTNVPSMLRRLMEPAAAGAESRLPNKDGERDDIHRTALGILEEPVFSGP